MPDPHTPAPLIVTLQLDRESQDYFNAQRKTYFPPHLNHLDAHLTLFHHLPADNEIIRTELTQAAARPPLEASVEKPIILGNGVAYALNQPDITAIYKSLQKKFDQWLIPQDRQGIRPHITVQNKVSADEARKLYESIKADFTPFTICFTGMNTWLYRGGPWEHVMFYPFEHQTVS